ncbi:hypothetical protein BHE74_00034425 [Ensete ventricosum]|nr:hypothetical protein GW17_00024393 [Ensete ventricosum]RWW58685.1 hypothetical protein BHE74_00034425 [Ensete ventricosum]RZS13320.1 hypothetical protein BHM03_00044887 [Ensete ventricosum]
MATSDYDGGIGGKLRRRPFRRAAATPYDRPPIAAARGLTTTVPEPGGDGWLAKLVDPASRFISSSASRLFSSIFRKRLAAPPAEETPGLVVVALLSWILGAMRSSCSGCSRTKVFGADA